MNPENRIAKTIVAMVAAGFMVVGLMNLGLYWVKCHHDQVAMGGGRSLYLSIPILIGIAILVKMRALAEWIEQYLDS